MIHQVKSQWYYYFWGAATIAVVAGQIFVGTGYRQMAEASKSGFEFTCLIDDIALTCKVKK